MAELINSVDQCYFIWLSAMSLGMSFKSYFWACRSRMNHFVVSIPIGIQPSNQS